VKGDGLTASILRFWAGALGGILLGWVAFRGAVFDPALPAFQCVTIGSMTALMLTAVRGGRPLHGVALVGAFGLLHLGLYWNEGWIRITAATASALFMGLGLFLAAVVFDALAGRGVRVLKFLVVGPLLGGIYFAISPLAQWGEMTGSGGYAQLFLNLYLGVIIGDGVALGIELIELLPGMFRVPPSPDLGTAAATAGAGEEHP
jgi:hypothetical protein